MRARSSLETWLEVMTLPALLRITKARFVCVAVIDANQVLHIASDSKAKDELEDAVLGSMGELIRLSVLQSLGDLPRIEIAVYETLRAMNEEDQDAVTELPGFSIFDRWMLRQIDQMVMRIEQHSTFFGALLTYWEAIGFMTALREAWLSAFMTEAAMMGSDQFDKFKKTLRDALLSRFDASKEIFDEERGETSHD